MEKKLRLFVTTSTIALSAAACAPNNSPLSSLPPASPPTSPITSPNPVVINPNVNSQAPVTHSHGGKVHSHRLPANGLNHTHAIGSGRPTLPIIHQPTSPPVINRPSPSVNRNTPVSHSHGGKVHSHRLPATGLSHTHAIGGGTPPRSQPNPNVVQPAPNNQPRQPVVNPNRGGSNHSHCGRAHSHPLPRQGAAHNHNNVNCQSGNQPRPTTPPRPSTPNTNYNYYDYSNNNRPPAPTTPPSSNNGNSTNNYYDYTGNTNTSPNNNYYGQARPKPSTTYTGNNSNTYNYTPPNPSTNNTSSPPPASTNSGSSSYTVQRGDTVFQVMRNTGVYWKDIIRLNNLQAPNYQINPGQRLRLR